MKRPGAFSGLSINIFIQYFIRDFSKGNRRIVWAVW